MRQPEDTRTLELLPEQKRGRGRPPVENPLTPAERAKRYRERKRWDRQCREERERITIPEMERDFVTRQPVTKNDSNEAFLLKLKIQQLEAQVAEYQRFQDQRADDEKRAQAAYHEMRSALVKAHDLIDKFKGGSVHIALQSRVDDLTGALDEVVQVTAAGKRVPAHMLKGLMKLLADA